MKQVVRLLAALIVVLAVYPFAFWISGALLQLTEQFWIASVVALVCSLGAGWLVWSRLASAPGAVITHVMTGCLVLGAVGFLAGFLGPMVFSPEANQGPLLGFFVTGPLGAALGALGGFAYGARARRQHARD